MAEPAPVARSVSATYIADGNYFHLLIDDQPFRFAVSKVETALRGPLNAPFVTITIPAHRVEVINQS